MLVFIFLMSLAVLRSPILQQNFPSEQNSHEKRASFPDLELIDENGFKEKISKFKGKVLIVSFWATWCKPCLDELPYFSELAKKFPENLHILAINEDENPNVKPVIDGIWERFDLPFKTYYDPTQELAKKVDLEVLPSNYILDRDGKLAFASYGVYNWKGEEALRFIKELINESPNNSK